MAGNIENLKMFDSNQCREKAKINGRKGGIASGVKKRERKAMREQVELLLTMPCTDNNIKAKLSKMGIDDTQIDNQMALVVATYLQALKGNTNAINIIRELIGERVTEINVNTTIDDKVKELDDLLKGI